MIRTADRYIFRQAFVATLFAVVLLSFFLVLGTIFQEIRPLLVENRLPVWLVGKFALNIFPSSLIFTIPWGFMAAVLLVFQRLSAENELHALQLSGMSLWRIAVPVFALAAMLGGFCLWVNLQVVPAAELSNLGIKYYAVETNPESLIKPGAITSQMDRNVSIFVESRDGNKVKSLHLYRLADPTKDEGSEYIYAEEASIGLDPQARQIKLMLNSAYIESTSKGKKLGVYSASAAPWKWDVTREAKLDPASMTNEQIETFLRNPPEGTVAKSIGKFTSVYHQRYSFAFASMAFACVAVPLGLTKRRKEGTGGVLVALLLGAGYFIFSVIANKSSDPSRVAMLLWTPNVLCVAVGLWLFHRARFR
jgi:lipopolysaccharide export LptBFGC system permease protein LptF